MGLLKEWFEGEINLLSLEKFMKILFSFLA
jgi:hypothetical protein